MKVCIVGAGAFENRRSVTCARAGTAGEEGLLSDAPHL